MASARPGGSREPLKTRERSRQRLIAAGFNSLELDCQLELFRQVQEGQHFYPVTCDQALTRSKREIWRIIKRLLKTAVELKGLWTEKGQRLLIATGEYGFMSSVPNALLKFSAILSGMLNDGHAKLPEGKKQAKIFLIQRTKEVTGAWHDAELAALCGDNTENWKVWRKTWYPTPRPSSLTPPPGAIGPPR